MKWLSSMFLILGGLFGIVICFLSNITVTSDLTFIDGLNLSMALGTFFIVAFLSGLYFLCSTS